MRRLLFEGKQREADQLAAKEMMSIPLRQHFNNDFLFSPRAKHRMDRRQTIIEPYIDNTSANGGYHAVVQAFSILGCHVVASAGRGTTGTIAFGASTLGNSVVGSR